MTDFNQSPYYDDYNKNGVGVNPFLRILFRPGYPIQSRELTQIQSILQGQIERFGTHTFKDGSKVTGGELSLNKIHFVVLKEGEISNISELDGSELRNNSGTVARVVSVTRSSISGPDAPRVLLLNYISGGQFVSGESIQNVGDSTWYDIDTTSGSVGHVTVASNNAGVFYKNGFFVHTPAQSIVLGRSWNLSCSVGFNFSDSIVTESTDDSLYDPAFGSNNFNAPGAHRYTIDLELASRQYTSVNETDPSFIELLKLNDGEVVTEIKNPKFNELEFELARRTYDESGSYTVKAFPISLEEHPTDDTKLSVVLDAGKAYVNGYEFQTISKTTLDLDKARDTEFYNNSDAYISYGSYYVVDNIVGGVFDVTQLEVVDLLDESAITIGTARVKAVYPDVPTKYRVYLTDIQISGGSSDDVRTISGSSGLASVDISGGVVDLMKGKNSVLIATFFPENPKVGSMKDVNYRTQRTFSGVLDSDKKVVIYTSSPSERFVGSGVYTTGDAFIGLNYIFLVDGVVTSPEQVDIPGVGNTEVGRLVASFSTGSTVQIVAPIEINASSPKTKIRKSSTKTLEVGSSWVDLDHADVVVGSFVVKNGQGVDVTNSYVFDDGQRDEYYTYGRIRNVGSSVETVTVEYDYFEHSGIGYFTVDSYSGVDYADIPKYTSGNFVYDLKSCFDFRPNVAGVVSSQIPSNNSNISFDYEYYVARYDRVVVTKSKELSIVRGAPELTPKVPAEPLDSMTLYILRVSPYTVNKRDVGVRFVENKRYTMRDIGKLEDRIENLEYYTSLSLLETKTTTLSVEGKFRNGFLVDPFSDYEIADTQNIEFDCFIDANNRVCAPSFIPKDRDAILVTVPEDVVQTEDGVLIKRYTETPFIKQEVITDFINVNPFNVFTWVGTAKLSPEIDNWIEEQRLPDVVNEILYDRVPADWKPTTTITSKVESIWLNGLYNNAAWNWDARNRLMEDFVSRYGAVNLGVTSISSHGVVGVASLKTTTTETTRVQESLKTVSSVDNVVSTTAIPYIRTKEVTVVVEGLLPNKRYYFLFDESDVNIHVKPLANGNIPTGEYGGAVYTNTKGILKAIFKIPAATFKTGERILRVSDDSVHNTAAETSYAVATYTAQGFLNIRQRTIILRRIREVVTDRVEKREVSFRWCDPLAQTFMVDEETYPEGVFLSSVDLFFVEKDEEIPVSVAIRPTVNGYPSSVETYPFAMKTLDASEVVKNNLSNSGLVGYAGTSFQPTRFKFDTPVHLSPGEHSFVVMANTNRYKVGYATIGEYIYNSPNVMTENPYNGVMFLSQNASTWSADQYSDLCFVLNRCSFEVGKSSDIVWNIGYEQDEVYDTLSFASGVTNFDATDYGFRLKTRFETDPSVELFETKNTEIDTMNIMSRRKMISKQEDVTVYGNITATEKLSPVVDLEQTHFIEIQNLVNNSVVGEENPYGGEAFAKYIHKKVTLTDDFVANEIRCWIDASVPTSADIKVYLKHQNTSVDSSAFGDLGWSEMPLEKISGIEREYRLGVVEGFNVYQVKVVMISSDTTQPPSFTNFRVVSFQE